VYGLDKVSPSLVSEKGKYVYESFKIEAWQENER
jgi:hypothetical protein